MALPPPSPNSTALVTGASSGIGLEIARQLAERGLNLTLVARRGERLRSIADELAATHGVAALALAVDLADAEARATIAPTLAGRGLVVDVLVNNAGWSTMGSLAKSRREQELMMIRTNVEAVVDLCTTFVPGMATRRRGAVLNTASTAAFQPLPGQAGYAASKSFVLSYSLAIAAELRGTGVTVTALCPGPVKTGFGESAGLTDDEFQHTLPKFMWVPVESVAKAAVDALSAGKAVVTPGIVNRAGALAGHLAPRSLTLPLLAKRHPALAPRRG